MTGLLVRLRALLRPAAERREADEELRYHLEQQVAQNAARGMTPDEARRAAQLALGGVERRKDEMGDARGISLFEHAARDVRHAWRSISRMPLTAAVIVLSLAIGIGANATIFSWIQLVVLNPLPGVRNASQIQLVEAVSEGGGYPTSSWLEYRDLREGTASFRDLLAFRMVPFNVGEPAHNERVFGLLTSGNYFRALGLRPALGRLLDTTDVSQGGNAPVAVISYGYWRSHFAGEADVVGQTLQVNGRDLTIVGVTPDGFQGTVLGLDFSLWTPATMAPVLFPGSRDFESRDQRGYHLMGLLAPGTSRAQASSDVNAVMTRLAGLYPESNAKIGGEVLPFWQAPNGPQRMLAGGLLVLQGVLLLLLLAVCGNTANLMLARASARQREMGARLALGAGRRHVISLVLTENLLLAVPGALLGVLIAAWGTNALRAMPFIGSFPIRFQTQADALTVAFAVGLGLLCGLVFGLAPALHLARTDPQLALRTGFGPVARGRARGVLMGAEVALALMVLVVAAMFMGRMSETRGADTGFRQAGILLVGYDRSGYNPPAAVSLAFADRLLARLRTIPGVEGAAISSSVPLDIHGLPLRSFGLEGRARDDAAPDRALTNTVTPGYFGVLDIPIRSGTDFAALNDPAPAPQAIVNEEFVRRYVGTGEPLGRKLRASNRDFVIVGVVANSLYDAFGEPPKAIVYYSYRDRTGAAGQMHIRTRPGNEAALRPAVERAVRELDPALPVFDVRTMAEHVDKNLFLRKIPARMFGVLGPLLLVLAAIGIYAVVDYAVALRTHEIGLRLALGASRRRVVGQLMGETLRAVGFGALAGLFVALLVAMHAARGVISLPVFVGVPFILLLVASVACWLPARRAARVDPMVALRRD